MAWRNAWTTLMICAVDSIVMLNVVAGDLQNLIEFLVIYLTETMLRNQEHVAVNDVAIHQLQLILMSIADSGGQQTLIDLVIYLTQTLVRNQEHVTVKLVAIHRLQLMKFFRVVLSHF